MLPVGFAPKPVHPQVACVRLLGVVSVPRLISAAVVVNKGGGRVGKRTLRRGAILGPGDTLR